MNFTVNDLQRMKPNSGQNSNTARRVIIRCLCVLLCLLPAAFLSACGKEVEQPYETFKDLANFTAITPSPLFSNKEKAFAADLCLPQDVRYATSSVDTDNVYAAALYDIGNAQTLFSYAGEAQVFPASTTKIMTALVALKYGNPSQEIVISERAANPGADAQRLALSPGDRMSLDQAIHYLMVFSANDVAIAIAENVGGSYENFVDMMNEEAHSLGATGTHFTNPHGLHEDGHYTTAYDLYLIFNEALKYNLFRNVLPLDSYDTVFIGSDGYSRSIRVNATDYYLTGDADPPEGITVIGGKTGTTDPAGHCLIILSETDDGRDFISVVMHSDSHEDLYEDMNSLLDEIPR